MVAQAKEDVVTLTRAQLQHILSAINGGKEADREEAAPDETEDSVHPYPCPLDGEDPVSPSKLLSRVEQKRLQWQKEKEEMLEWNPWGRPGAGAPVRKTQVVAPITNNQLLTVQTSGVMSSALSSPSSYSYAKPVPPAFKSSIAFGGENESYSSDFYRRHHWMEDQEIIRDEPPKPLVTADEFHRSPVKRRVEPGDEERRARALEYQRAIRMQMEEKRCRAEEERERRRLEEEAEERRLREERARLCAEYEEEQRRAHLKAELEEQKQRALASAVAVAQAEAEAERKAARQHKKEDETLAQHMEVALRIQTPPTTNDLPNTLESKVCGEAGVQTETPYVMDRVLTPSVFRVRGRECATQTDDHDAPSTESSTSSLVMRKQRRPKWGANQPTKAYVRASERDPRRRRVLRRRAASSSDCTTLSSELETRSYQPIRSRSTPRSSGVRSDCGRWAAPAVLVADSMLPALGPRRQWRSQESVVRFSPPRVPGVRPRMLGELARYPHATPARRKWSDQESFDLDSVVRAASQASSEDSSAPSLQNPLVCPEVVTGRPTPRQDRILQNLSSLRQGLLKKQRELENLIRRPPPYYS